MRAILLRFLLLMACAAPVASQPLEVITLHHRTAEQVLPPLLPFVEPGGTLTGINDRLFLRASAANRAEIRRLLEALDTPVRRLLIRVRQDGELTTAAGGAAGGVVVASDGSKVGVGGTARAYSSDRRLREDSDQQVQTIDGGRAAIRVGQSFLVPMRQLVLTPAGAVVADSFVQRDLGTGFVAVPRLSGERVTLEISPTHDAPGTMPNSINVQRLMTTVSGRLGEWIELGGSVRDEVRSETGTARYGTRSGGQVRRLLLRVDEVR